jgi:peptide/nickel transport system substrate-binding protein
MKKLLLLVACAAAALSTSVSAQTLKIGLNEDPDMLDPDLARTFVGRIVFTSMCDKLVDINEKLEIVPQLATSWEWAKDNTSITFKLRDGVTFQDGTPFNAEAVKFNIERSQNIKGSQRRSELSSVSKVEIIDDHTVKLDFSKPDATVLAQLADRAGMMIATSAGEDFAQNPVCSGPYQFSERVQNDRIVLKKYPNYWNAGAYHFDQVIFLPIPDTTVRLANLQSGDLQLIERAAATDVPAIEADSRLKLQQVVGLGYQGISINVNNGDRATTPIGQNKLIRQAFSMSIDRDAINQIVFAGTNPPAWQAFPPASPYYDKALKEPKRDIDGARALLAEAGVKNVDVELSFGNNNVSQQVNELVQSMTAEAGFNVTLTPTEFATMLNQNQAGNFQASQFGWSGRVDPDGNVYNHWTCKGGLNYSHYCNPEVDKLLDEARQTSDVEARKALYAKADALFAEDNPIVYLYYQSWIYAYQAGLKGFQAYPDGMIRLKDVTLEK